MSEENAGVTPFHEMPYGPPCGSRFITPTRTYACTFSPDHGVIQDDEGQPWGHGHIFDDETPDTYWDTTANINAADVILAAEAAARGEEVQPQEDLNPEWLIAMRERAGISLNPQPDVEPLPQREPGAAYDHDALLRELFGGVPSAPLRRVEPNPFTAAVRVRFVDLPHRNVPREVFGLQVHTIEPGGFALVVDRFKGHAHRDGEREAWEAFGAKIGAATVLCYPGELDIVGWLDGS